MITEVNKKIISKYIKIINYPTKSKIKNFIKKNKLNILLDKKYNLNQFIDNKVMLPPEIDKLYNLFHLIIKNKRLKVLELGSGYSSIVLANALKINKKNILNEVMKYSVKKHYTKNQINKNSQFKYTELFTMCSVDDQKKWVSKTRNLLKKYDLLKFTKLIFLKSSLTKFNDRFCYSFSNLPFFNSDFIYVDGPTMGTYRGKNNFEPISCDILKMEYMFFPGTIIVLDGMAANSIFYRNNLQRNWIYFNENNVSYFYLNEKALGPHNSNQLKFYKNI